MRVFPWARRSDLAGSEADPAVPIDSDLARWHALLESTEDAIVLADRSGRILLSNTITDQLFAVPPLSPGAPAPSAPAHNILTHTLSSDMDHVFREAVRRGTSLEAEVSVMLPLPRTLHVRVTPVSEQEFLIVLRDLTELRRLERVRQDFVANVSHELRTPLTSIKAMAETLLDGARVDEAVAPRFLQTIIHESDRLVRLSSDLLDLSRVEAQGVKKVPVELGALVAEVASRLSPQALKAGLTLTNTVRSPLVVSADRDEMAQVLVNLLDNAIAYTPHGGAILLSAEDHPDAVTIHLADTGIGILSHDIPRLFERFYRADRARSRASGGTGLGLSIVKHIVEGHGGTVGVESEYNHGSIFTFTLPK